MKNFRGCKDQVNPFKSNVFLWDMGKNSADPDQISGLLLFA